MSSDDFSSLHDVYDGLSEDEKCQKTTYIVHFLWRDLSSDFNVVGPYLTVLHQWRLISFTQWSLG